MPVTIQTSRVADAGTLVGLIVRLGGLGCEPAGLLATRRYDRTPTCHAGGSR